jgi:hypothetical protein
MSWTAVAVDCRVWSDPPQQNTSQTQNTPPRTQSRIGIHLIDRPLGSLDSPSLCSTRLPYVSRSQCSTHATTTCKPNLCFTQCTTRPSACTWSYGTRRWAPLRRVTPTHAFMRCEPPPVHTLPPCLRCRPTCVGHAGVAPTAGGRRRGRLMVVSRRRTGPRRALRAGRPRALGYTRGWGGRRRPSRRAARCASLPPRRRGWRRR